MFARLAAISIVCVGLWAGTNSVAAAKLEDITCALPTGLASIVCFDRAGTIRTVPIDGFDPQAVDRRSKLTACGNRLLLWIERYRPFQHAVFVWDGSVWSIRDTIIVEDGTRLNGVVCSGDGTIFAISSFRAGVRLGHDWHFTLPDGLERGVFTQSIAGGPAKTALTIFEDGTLARFDGTKWARMPRRGWFDAARWPPRIEKPLAIAVDSRDRVWISSEEKWWHFDGERWTAHSGPYYAKKLAFDGAGALWAFNYREVSALKNARWETTEVQHYVHDEIYDLSPTSDGAAWFTTAYGIHRIAEGKFESRQMNNAAIPRNKFHAVATFGRGGVLPPPTEQPGGPIEAVVTYLEKAAAHAEIVVCIRKVWLEADNDPDPCAGKPQARRGRTDAEGRFRIDSAAPGEYAVLARLPGTAHWLGTMPEIHRWYLHAPGTAPTRWTLKLYSR